MLYLGFMVVRVHGLTIVHAIAQVDSIMRFDTLYRVHASLSPNRNANLHPNRNECQPSP